LHETLFNAIAHGDEKHRAWLKQAIDDHFAGRPVLRPDETSSTVETKEVLQVRGNGPGKSDLETTPAPEASLVKAFQQSPRRVDSGVFSRPCSRCGKEVRSNDPVAISATVLYCSIECAD
jgi:hypothetical protein